jgi:ABC-type multidrug transport system permease subunit
MSAAWLGQWYAFRGALLQQWRVSSKGIERWTFIFSTAPNAAVLAWVVRESTEPLALAYVSLGSFMMALWNGGVFRVGWSLTNELWSGTFELSIASKSPAFVITFGKALALIASSIIAGAASFFVVVAVAQDMLSVDSIPLLFVSLVVAFIALAAGCFIFAPLMALSRGRGGFFNAFLPLGTVLSGFLYPLTTLPKGLEVVGHLLPTSWAMDAVIRSADGSGSVWTVVGEWGIAISVAIAWLGISFVMFQAVEKRLRVLGQLAG